MCRSTGSFYPPRLRYIQKQDYRTTSQCLIDYHISKSKIMKLQLNVCLLGLVLVVCLPEGVMSCAVVRGVFIPQLLSCKNLLLLSSLSYSVILDDFISITAIIHLSI